MPSKPATPTEVWEAFQNYDPQSEEEKIWKSECKQKIERYGFGAALVCGFLGYKAARVPGMLAFGTLGGAIGLLAPIPSCLAQTLRLPRESPIRKGVITMFMEHNPDIVDDLTTKYRLEAEARNRHERR